MYTEEYEDRGTPIKNLVIKVVVAIIFLIGINVTVKYLTKTTYTNTSNINTNPYKNATFKENIDTIESAMLGYFEEEKVEKMKKKKLKVTLAELIEDGVLVPIIDNKDKVCKSSKSYVQLEEIGNNDYLLRINLECSKDKDYVLKHLVHTNYCSDYLCEKEAATISTKTTKPTKIVKFSDEEKLNPNITVIPQEETPYVPAGDRTLQYEYGRTTGAKIGQWSDWSGWLKTSCDTQAENCDDNNPLCRRKIVLFSQEEKTGNYQNRYEAPRKALTQSTTSQLGGCSNYNYAIVDGVTYATSGVYSMINNISKDTKATQGNWEYKGQQTFDTVPSDTYNKIYKFIEMNFDKCKETCSEKPIKYVYDVYEYTGTLSNVAEHPDLLCSGSIDKITPVYESTDTVDSQSRKEPVYGKICYYNMKTRTVKNKGNTATQFSTFNDGSFLSTGFYYTGKIK